MKLLIIIASITTVICTDLFHEPRGQIHLARYNCTKDSSIEATCYDLCALERSMMLTPEGNAINSKEFGPSYQKSADECWTFESKPTCEEAHDFLECFLQKSTLAIDKTMASCQKEYPVENLETIKMSVEVLAENQNLACLIACFVENSSVFNDDDTINMDSINPHIPFDFDAQQAAKECEESNQQDDKCQKRSTRYTCLITSYGKAIQEEFAKERSELAKV